MYLNGYDFDGVVSEGIVPVPDISVIITGRTEDSREEIQITLDRLNASSVPIIFYPDSEKLESLSKIPDGVSHEIGVYKGETIKNLGVQNYYEDTPIQAEIIKAMNPKTNVFLYQEGKITELL